MKSYTKGFHVSEFCQPRCFEVRRACWRMSSLSRNNLYSVIISV